VWVWWVQPSFPIQNSIQKTKMRVGVLGMGYEGWTRQGFKGSKNRGWEQPKSIFYGGGVKSVGMVGTTFISHTKLHTKNENGRHRNLSKEEFNTIFSFCVQTRSKMIALYRYSFTLPTTPPVVSLLNAL
jgi:hypothetical protein